MEECMYRLPLSSVQAPGLVYHMSTADVLIAPTTFSRTAAESGEEWLEYSDKYFEFRHIKGEDKIRLLACCYVEQHQTSMSTLTHHQLQSYDDLRYAFKETYDPSHELRYQEASALWRDVRDPHEKFDDFMTRVKKREREGTKSQMIFCTQPF
jgi:hypothetical protein